MEIFFIFVVIMRLIKSDDIIILDCTYHQKDVAIFLGFKWDRDVKCWYSNNRNKNKRLSTLSDDDLIEIEKKFKDNFNLSFAANSDIDIPKPDGLDYLPFQKAGIEFAIKNQQTLNASEMGLGKSIQAIGYMNYSQFKNVLVVTTASLKLNWQKEIEKWITYPINIQVLESSKKFKYDDGVLICNYDVLKKFSDQLERSNFDLIIADEVHYVKNKHAMRSFVFYKIVKNIPFKMYLSGTPVVDRPLELYDIIKSLGYTRTKSEYTSLYCPVVHNGFAFVPGPATNLDLLQKELRSQFMYRVMKKDVLKELPDKFKQIIYIDDKKSLKAEQNAIKGFMNNTNLSNEEYNSFINSTTAFTPQFIGMIAQIRKETAINKLPFSINLIKETLESKDKIVVFAHHKEVVNGLYEAFKNIAVKIDGGTKMEDRQLAVDKFQNDKGTKLFIGSILAAGTGITLTASNHVIFVEMDWTPSNMTQAEDRCIFAGQWVLTSNGYVNIEDVVIGDLVYTHNGNFKKVINKHTHLERKKIRVDINAFGFNDNLSLTEDHKVYIYDKTKREFLWIEAKSIDIRNHYLTFRGNIQPLERKKYLEVFNYVDEDFNNNFGIKQKNGRLVKLLDRVILTDDLLYAFGFFIAEGWTNITSKSSCTVNVCQKITNKKMYDAAEYIIEIIKKSFDIEDHSSYVNELKEFKTCTIHSKNLAINFEKWFGKGAHNKQLPDWTVDLNEEQLSALLSGFYHGDGYRRKNTQQAATSSKKLLSQLMIFNANLKRRASISKKMDGTFAIEYALSDTEIDKIIEECGYICYPIKQLVFSKPKRGSERVYDLTVEDDHSFVVGNYNVHNCHRIGQHDNVTIQYIVVNNSIDALVAKKLIKKEKVFDEIFNR